MSCLASTNGDVHCVHRRRQRTQESEVCIKPNLVPDAALLHPLSDEFLGRPVLVVVLRINEIDPGLVERIEQLERALLAHLTGLPFVSDTHTTDAQRRGVDARKEAELAGVAKLGLKLRGWLHLGSCRVVLE